MDLLDYLRVGLEQRQRLHLAAVEEQLECYERVGHTPATLELCEYVPFAYPHMRTEIRDLDGHVLSVIETAYRDLANTY